MLSSVFALVTRGWPCVPGYRFFGRQACRWLAHYLTAPSQDTEQYIVDNHAHSSLPLRYTVFSHKSTERTHHFEQTPQQTCAHTDTQCVTHSALHHALPTHSPAARHEYALPRDVHFTALQQVHERGRGRRAVPALALAHACAPVWWGVAAPSEPVRAAR